jgi:hypothetical protein
MDADERLRKAIEEETTAKRAQQEAAKVEKEIIMRNIQVDGRMALLKELIPHMRRALEELDHTELVHTLDPPCHRAPPSDDHGPPPCRTH